ncbi:hypothetical protein [Rhizobium sp. YK2]|uniref:hypothetical protein n=1 Tax=Rhizobium sp. YK2 TaxID=1860096 RepID=UPI00084CC711|nr:hypothetical protein [Rhizobium sp. YK2]OED00965.1 hypothetical protein A9Z06_13600 [Rhizobium sp. YK2]
MAVEFVLMTILGCSESGMHCRYIATADERWESISQCGAVSENRLLAYRDRPYPVIVAVCQKPEPKAISDISVKPLIKQSGSNIQAPQSVTQQSPSVTQQDKKRLAEHAIEQVGKVLPTAAGLKTVLGKPVRFIESGYSWVARRFE